MQLNGGDSDRHPGPADAQHGCKHVVGDWNVVSAQARPGDEEPADPTLNQAVAGVDGGGFHNLADERLTGETSGVRRLVARNPLQNRGESAYYKGIRLFLMQS